MRCKLTLPGTLPGLNEYIRDERTNRLKAAAVKRGTENLIGYCIKEQLRNVKFTRPVSIRYLWVESNKRRDKDNIAFAKKFVQDALVTMGVLQNDGWREIASFTDEFAVDAKNPRVEIEICEVCDG